MFIVDNYIILPQTQHEVVSSTCTCAVCHLVVITLCACIRGKTVGLSSALDPHQYRPPKMVHKCNIKFCARPKHAFMLLVIDVVTIHYVGGLSARDKYIIIGVSGACGVLIILITMVLCCACCCCCGKG